MAFPPSFLDELTARNPIEDVVGQYVNLKRSGSNLFGLCPFHGEKTASFSVAPDKGIYYCFGCHKGGSVINFQMEIEGLSYPDAVRALAKRVGMEVPEDEQYQSRYRQQERLWALHKEAARYFHSQLYAPIGAQALNYALGRGMSRKILTTFGVGFAPDSWDGLCKAMQAKGYTEQELKVSGLVTVSQKNGRMFDRFRGRLMFPIIDVRGNVIAFGGRIIAKDSDAAKYLNSPETLIFNKRKNLFGLNLAKKTKHPYFILVEGNIDVVALHQYGFDNAVASLGTSLTDEQAVLLSRYTEQVVLIYDGDAAGQRATQRAIPILEKAGLQVKVLQLRDAKDPDEFLKKFGADRLKLLLEESTNRVEYQLNAILAKYDLKNNEQKEKYVQEAANLISKLGSPVRRELYGNRVAEIAGVSEDAMKKEIENIRDGKIRKEDRRWEREAVQPVKNLQPKERSLRYDDVKSAKAEEGLLAMILTEPSLLSLTKDLRPEEFSTELCRKAYVQFNQRYWEGLDVSLACLSDFSSEEMSHLVAVYSSFKDKISEKMLTDYVRVIQSRYQAKQAHKLNENDALRAIHEKYKNSEKGLK